MFYGFAARDPEAGHASESPLFALSRPIGLEMKWL